VCWLQLVQQPHLEKLLLRVQMLLLPVLLLSLQALLRLPPLALLLW
jgi:hypothetical protein